jgi:hypothetical protein
MSSAISRRTVTMAVSLATLLLLVLGVPRASADVATVTGGQTDLFTPLTVVQELGADRVYVAPLPPATLTFTLEEGPAVHFPVTDGVIDTDSMTGTVNHSGGLKILKFSEDFSTVESQLDITNLRIFNNTQLLGDTQDTPLLSPAADLANPTHTYDPVTGKIHYEADAQVPAAAALVLNTYFNTTVFQAGMTLGHVKSNIQTDRVLALPATFVRPKGATPFNASLVPAFAPCTFANRTHAAPLGYGSCNPPAQVSHNVTIGTPDANENPAEFVGSVRFGVATGNPLTPADEADVAISASLSDIRNTGSLSDYEGELRLSTPLRITDRNSTGGQTPLSEAATATDSTLDVTVPCAPTADPAVGSDCAVSTTADTVVPGSVQEGQRAVWAMNQVKVYDGGASGLASAPDSTVFAVQGIFAP